MKSPYWLEWLYNYSSQLSSRMIDNSMVNSFINYPKISHLNKIVNMIELYVYDNNIKIYYNEHNIKLCLKKHNYVELKI